MVAVSMKTLSGEDTEVDLSGLAAAVLGGLLLPSSDGYDEARSIWNAMVDKRPAAVVECAVPADVAHAVRFAATHGVLLSICGAGHNIAGNAVCDGGLMISFKKMRSELGRRRASA